METLLLLIIFGLKVYCVLYTLIGAAYLHAMWIHPGKGAWFMFEFSSAIHVSLYAAGWYAWFI